MKKLLLLLFILNFFSNCTVQKRVYRKGWSVQMSTKLKSSNQNKETSQIDELPNKEVSIKERVEVKATFIENQKFIPQNVHLSLVDDEVSETKPNVAFEKNTTGKTQTEVKFKTVKRAPGDDTIKESKGSVIGLLLLITSFLAFGLTALLLSAELTTLTIVAASILGAVGLAFLILGLFKIIRYNRERKNPKLKEERLNRVRAKKETEEYNPNKTNVVISIISLTIVIGLIFLLRNIEE